MSNNNTSEPLTFMQHLIELRKHIFRSAFYLVFFAALAFIYRDIIFDTILLSPRTPQFITNTFLCKLAQSWDISMLCINQNPVKLINTSMTGQFTVHITVSLIAGIILAFPFIIWEFWKFISPALNDKERKNTSGFIMNISALFFTGVLFGYYIVVPLSLNFLAGYIVSNQIENYISVTSYCSTIASLILACGALFELPVIVFILSRIGLITPANMRTYRRHSIVVIFIIAAIITPPDIFSQTLVAIPLLLLYEISIFVSKYAVNKRNAN